MIKRFELEDGLLLACACDSTLCGQVAVSWKYGRPPKAVVMTMDQPDAQPLTDISVETIGGTPCALLSPPTVRWRLSFCAYESEPSLLIKGRLAAKGIPV